MAPVTCTPLGEQPFPHRRDLGEPLVDRPVRVGLAVPLGAGDQQPGVPDPGRERPLGSAQVRHQRDHLPARGGRQPAEQLVGVGHLRHQPRADERADLHRADARRAQPVVAARSLVSVGTVRGWICNPSRSATSVITTDAGWAIGSHHLPVPECSAISALLSSSRSASTSAVCSPSSGPSQRTRPGCCAELRHDAGEQHRLGLPVDHDLHVEQHVAGPEVRVRGHLGGRVDRTGGHLRRHHHGHHLGERPGRGELGDRVVEQLAVPRPGRGCPGTARRRRGRAGRSRS